MGRPDAERPQRWWRCGDSNPGPRRPLPGLYERSLRFDLALMAPVDGIRERRSVLDVPLSGGGRALGGQVGMGDAQTLSGRQGEAERAAYLGRVRVLRSVRVYCLPLFTRPAAPRLATRVGIVQVDTNHPRVPTLYANRAPPVTRHCAESALAVVLGRIERTRHRSCCRVLCGDGLASSCAARASQPLRHDCLIVVSWFVRLTRPYERRGVRAGL